MLIFIRNRSLKPLPLLNPNFLHLLPFSSLQTSSESNPNSTSSERVKSLFISHGFTETQISKIIKIQPRILSVNPDKILAPKFDFFLSIGIPKSHLPRILCNSPILKSSLEKQLIPCYNLLTEIGISKSRIRQLLVSFPSPFGTRNAKFKGAVEATIEMGFKPANWRFICALRILCVLSKTTWDRKVMIFKSWGLSDDEVGIAFRSYPNLMYLSEEKNTKVMDIYVNEMGHKAADVVRSSYILDYNIENRIEPRCRVIKFLMSKGFLKETISLGNFITVPETKFLEKFVIKYMDRVPELQSICLERRSI